MKRLAFIVLLACAAGSVLAQSSGGAYAIRRHVVAGGGGQSAGGSFSLNGTVGQHDAAPAATGGPYTLAPGYWGPAAAPGQQGADPIFSNGFE